MTPENEVQFSLIVAFISSTVSSIAVMIMFCSLCKMHGRLERRVHALDGRGRQPDIEAPAIRVR